MERPRPRVSSNQLDKPRLFPFSLRPDRWPTAAAGLEALLDGLDTPIFITDAKTCKLLYINDRFRAVFGDLEGHWCDRALHHAGAQSCLHCDYEFLGNVGEAALRACPREVHSAAVGRWFHLVEHAITWDGSGRSARLHIAIDVTAHKRAARAVESRAALQSALTDISHRLLAANEITMRGVLDSATSRLRECLNADVGVLMLVDGDLAEISIRDGRLHDSPPAHSRIALGEIPALMAALSGKTLSSECAEQLPVQLQNDLARVGLDNLGAVLLAPANYADGQLAVLAGLGSEKPGRCWMPHEREAVQRLAAMIGAAVSRQRRFDQVRASRDQLLDVAFKDPLTRLANRLPFIEGLHAATASARRTGRHVAVCFVDLDGFKAVNDGHGHAIGDRLLVQVAERLRDGLRANDLAARWGGDEFAILLTELPDDDHCIFGLERLRATLAEPYRIDGHELIVSGSIGVSRFPRDGEDCDHLLECADKALYTAKESGRNEVVVYETPCHSS